MNVSVCNLYVFTQPGCDAKSIFKWSTAGLNLEYSFS